MSFLLRNALLGGLSWRSFALFDAAGEAGGAAAAAVAPAGGDGAAAAAAAAAPAAAAIKDPAAGAAAAGDGAAAAAPGAATIAGGAAPAAPAAVQAKWPDNWRQEMAGDDKAYLKTLERYDSPAAVAKALRELSGKVSSGELKAPAKPLPADATPEQQAAWRKEQGLPETAEAFVGALKLANGVVPGESDKPLLGSFAALAHAKGWDQGRFNDAVDWYFGMQDQMRADQQKADGQFHNDSMVALTQEWGKETQGNINAISGLVAMLPESIRDGLLTARTPTGQVLGDNPDFNRGMLMLAKMINPAAAILPAAAGGGLSSTEARIAEIEKDMKAAPGTPAWANYWKNDKAQGELRELYSARETMKERAGTRAA